MRNRTYGGVRGRKTKVGRKLLRFPPTRLFVLDEPKKKSCRNNSSSIIYMQMCDFSLHLHLPLENLLEIVN